MFSSTVNIPEKNFSNRKNLFQQACRSDCDTENASYGVCEQHTPYDAVSRVASKLISSLIKLKYSNNQIEYANLLTAGNAH